jgi:glycosyltransferase involved in cell wall biosynthesis
MCPSLADNGNEVHLVICGEEFEIPRRLKEKGVKVHLFRLPSNRFNRMWRTARDIFKKGVQLNGDLYHFHDPECLPYALKWHRKLKRPFVYDIHENYPDDILTKEWLPKPLRKYLAYCFKIWEHYAAFRLDGLVTATENIASRFYRHPHCVIVKNYPLLEEFQHVPNLIRSKNNHFVYSGRISKLRGAVKMVQAMEWTKSLATLELIGFFDSQNLKQNCMSKPGWLRTIYHGKLNRIDISLRLANATAGLVLFQPDNTHLTALPNKLFEYFAAGLPVIASDFPLWRKIIMEEGCGILVDPSNPVNIAAAMDYLSNHPTEAHAMGQRGRAAVERQYNWEAEFPKLQSLYTALF